MIPRIDVIAIDTFNKNAQVLESVVIGGRKFDMIHDYWHHHPQINYQASVMVLSRGEYFPVPATPYRRNSKNAVALANWAKETSRKYLND